MNKRILILKSSASKSIFLSVLFGLTFATNGFAATGAAGPDGVFRRGARTGCLPAARPLRSHGFARCP